jgi:hypothetical protein
MVAVSVTDRPARSIRRAAAWLAAVLLLGSISPGAQSSSTVEQLLRGRLGFSARDLRNLDKGSSVIRGLDTRVHEELANVGAVFVDALPGTILDLFRDIEQFEKGPGIPQIGRFSNPPRLEDLQSLTFTLEDIEALRDCRPGDCDVKLPEAAMQRFKHDVDWSSEEASEQANDVLRQMVLDLVLAYQRDGNASFGYYDDGNRPLSIADEFRALLAATDPLPTPVPTLLAYLDSYPLGRPAGAEDFFYWTVVDFGLKLTIRVNHVALYPVVSRPASGVAYVIAIKQLYASHYFHTTLELRFLMDDDRPSTQSGTSLISITRSRSDGMTGFKGFLLRPIIRRRAREAVRKYLEHVKRQVERPGSRDS